MSKGRDRKGEFVLPVFVSGFPFDNTQDLGVNEMVDHRREWRIFEGIERIE